MSDGIANEGEGDVVVHDGPRWHSVMGVTAGGDGFQWLCLGGSGFVDVIWVWLRLILSGGSRWWSEVWLRWGY